MKNLIQIAVVDDERIIREQTIKLIEKQMEKQGERESFNWEVEAYSSGEELLASKKSFDVFFLDIQMEGINGIEIAGKIRARDSKSIIIFITGVREYVFQAFDVAAFHYLLKPIEEEKFAEVFGKALLEVKKHRAEGQEQIFIETRDKKIILNRNSILYVESRGKKVEIHTSKGVIEVYGAMKEFEQLLAGEFYRCHRGYLVNLGYIEEYTSDSIVLSNGEAVILSKDKYSEFVKAYMRYLKNGGVIHA